MSASSISVAADVDVALVATHLTKRYGGGVVALSETTLEIRRGGITALVGPNAAGKSTLIRTWMGFEKPTSGSATVFGHDPWRDRRRALARVGYVPQASALYRDLTIAEHLDMAARGRHAFDRGAAIARLNDLAIPLRAKAGRLSGGQQAQVSLAVAIGSKADVLLLDEPLASLDPLSRRDFLSVLVGDARSRGATALLSSHVIGDIEQSCERIVVLGTGRVLLDGGIDAILAGHWIAGSESFAGRRIAQVPTEGDEAMLVVATAQPSKEARRPTLEQVVFGYLVAHRASGAS